MEQPAPVDFSIRATPETRNGVYANFAQVRHTQFDFVLDFGQILPPETEEEVKEARMKGRVELQSVARVVIPAKMVQPLIDAMRDNLSKHQQKLRQGGKA